MQAALPALLMKLQMEIQMKQYEKCKITAFAHGLQLSLHSHFE